MADGLMIEGVWWPVDTERLHRHLYEKRFDIVHKQYAGKVFKPHVVLHWWNHVEGARALSKQEQLYD